MARRLRIEFNGGLYHVTSRGDGAIGFICRTMTGAIGLIFLRVFASGLIGLVMLTA